MKMRGVLVTALSFALTTGVVANAFWQKKQFYPSVVYITKSSPSLAILYLQAFVMVALMWKLIRKIFFGQLRAAENEHLIERSWYAITETCLAFTVFRDDFSPRFVALFTLLLFVKGFHWLTDDRVDFMERSPLISFTFHLRALSIMSLLSILDLYFIHHAYYMTLMKGASVQLVFGFEYAILLTMVMQTAIKYLLHTIDLQTENPWEKKAVYLLYTELCVGFVRVGLYLIFLMIMIKVHTFPLFAIRPMYLTIRAFRKALNDVILSRRAIHNMNTLYPDATPEELAQGDNVCIICREEMVDTCKKLPCNHIFHRSCLRSWFQRQQTCPTCRMDILRPTVRPNVDRLGQQPQQQPQAALNPFFQQGFGMWMPQAAPAAGAPPPASSAAGSASAAPGASSAEAGAVPPPFSAFMQPPPMPGMGMFPPMPGMMPPFPGGGQGMYSGFPNMPANLQGLSPEELALMEGQERQNVAKRIECLQNIRTLLDASFMQIQQYYTIIQADSARPVVTSVVGAPASDGPTLASGATTPSSANWRPASQGVTTVTSSTHTVPSTKVGAPTTGSTSSPSAPGLSQSATTPSSDVSDAEGAVGGVSSADLVPEFTRAEPVEGADMNEVRRRRLEKLSSSNLTLLDKDSDGIPNKDKEGDSK